MKTPSLCRTSTTQLCYFEIETQLLENCAKFWVEMAIAESMHAEDKVMRTVSLLIGVCAMTPSHCQDAPNQNNQRRPTFTRMLVRSAASQKDYRNRSSSWTRGALAAWG